MVSNFYPCLLSFISSVALQESAVVTDHGFSHIILKIQNLPVIGGNGKIKTLFTFHAMENIKCIYNLISYP